MPNIEIIQSSQWPTIRDNLPPSVALWKPLIPASGKTILHGPPGSGKTSLAHCLANQIEAGAPSYLGLDCLRASCFLLSIDMNIYGLKEKWGTAFQPAFDFVCLPSFDSMHAGFRTTTIYRDVRQYVEKHNKQLIIIDALGGTHLSHSAKDDETADATCAALSEWFPERTLLILHHDRKRRYGPNGEPQAPTEDDFLGSVKWRANMTSQIHMWPIGEHVSQFKHEKSQVSIELDDPVKCYINLDGTVEPWDQHRADEVRAKYFTAIQAHQASGLSVGEQDATVAKHWGKSERTVRRWRTLHS